MYVYCYIYFYIVVVFNNSWPLSSDIQVKTHLWSRDHGADNDDDVAGCCPAGGADCGQEEEQEGEVGVPGQVERLWFWGGHMGARESPVHLYDLRPWLQPSVRREAERQHVAALHPQLTQPPL